MSDFDKSDIPDEDQVEITDLDLQDGVASASLSLELLKLARKAPLFANSGARSTMLAWLACVIMLLFLVQPGLPKVPKQTSKTPVQGLQSPLAIVSTTSAHSGTWIRISHGKVIVIQAGYGRIGWHYCKVQRWFSLPKHAHTTVVVCI